MKRNLDSPTLPNKKLKLNSLPGNPRVRYVIPDKPVYNPIEFSIISFSPLLPKVPFTLSGNYDVMVNIVSLNLFDLTLYTGTFVYTLTGYIFFELSRTFAQSIIG